MFKLIIHIDILCRLYKYLFTVNYIYIICIYLFIIIYYIFFILSFIHFYYYIFLFFQVFPFNFI